MARPLRIDLAGGIYHVMSRGIDRSAIFADDRDRKHFLEILAGAQSRFRLRLYAYVLMDNHFHLIVCTPDANLSRAMQWIKVSYSMWHNARHRRVGPLFQGRFRSELVDESDSWLVELSLYVHLNPVRIAAFGLGKRDKAAEDKGWVEPTENQVRERLAMLRSYRWSSYPFYSDARCSVPEWLDISVVLDRVGTRGSSKREYARLAERRIAHGYEETFLHELKNRLALGGPSFHERIKALCSPLDRDISCHRELRPDASWTDVVGTVENLLGKTWADLQQRGEWGRYLVLWGAQRYAGMTLKQIAERCGYSDYGAVNMGIRRLVRRSERVSAISTVMAAMDEMFNVQT